MHALVGWRGRMLGTLNIPDDIFWDMFDHAEICIVPGEPVTVQFDAMRHFLSATVEVAGRGVWDELRHLLNANHHNVTAAMRGDDGLFDGIGLKEAAAYIRAAIDMEQGKKVEHGGEGNPTGRSA